VGHTRSVGPIRTLIDVADIQTAAAYQVIIVQEGDSPEQSEDIVLMSTTSSD